MIKIAQPRRSKPNECATFETKSGRTVVSITQARDSVFYVFVSELNYDEENDVYYWSDFSQNLGGIYDSVSTAREEATQLIGEPLFDISGAN